MNIFTKLKKYVFINFTLIKTFLNLSTYCYNNFYLPNGFIHDDNIVILENR